VLKTENIEVFIVLIVICWGSAIFMKSIVSFFDKTIHFRLPLLEYSTELLDKLNENGLEATRLTASDKSHIIKGKELYKEINNEIIDQRKKIELSIIDRNIELVTNSDIDENINTLSDLLLKGYRYYDANKNDLIQLIGKSEYIKRKQFLEKAYELIKTNTSLLEIKNEYIKFKMIEKEINEQTDSLEAYQEMGI
jgi:hypothetical protein